jgi:hypothetical protein
MVSLAACRCWLAAVLVLGFGCAAASSSTQYLAATLQFEPQQTHLPAAEREKVRRIVDRFRERLPARMDCLWFHLAAETYIPDVEQPTSAQLQLAHRRLANVRALLAELGLRNLPSHVFSVSHVSPGKSEDPDAVHLSVNFDTQGTRHQATYGVDCDWRPAW